MSLSSSYKKWHAPSKNPDSKIKQGYYRVQHPEKYIGDPNLVIYRSSWEWSFCRWCDFSPSIKRWSSEPTQVPYYDRVSKLEECKKLGLNPNDPKNWVIKQYHTDFWVEIDKGNNIVEKMFIEIKPSDKLRKPTPPTENSSLKEQRRFNIQAKEYLINEAKWCAMNAWAQKNNTKFYVFTEKILEKLLGRFWPQNME